MLKLIIADDERVIRETISNLIDWKELGINLAGLCKDGIEAYNMILDEAPDIVMTDIRMPGLSGLELVREIKAADLPVQFIILSGYGEFEYAREAMKYGVKQYLLKPCKEEQIRENILQAAEDVRKLKTIMAEKEQKNVMLSKIRQDAMYHMIADGIALDLGNTSLGLKKIIHSYSQYMDFYHKPYRLYRIFYLEPQHLEEFLEDLKSFGSDAGIPVLPYGVYVKNTLILFEPEEQWEQIAKKICREEQLDILFETQSFACLAEVFEMLIPKIRRYDMIQVIQGEQIISIANNHTIFQWIQKLYEMLEQAEEGKIEELCDEILQITKDISDLEFLRMIAGSISVHFSALNACSAAESAEFMLKVNLEEDIGKIKTMLEVVTGKAKHALCNSKRGYGVLAEEVMEYVKNNISDSNLTLKKIAEQHLFMNVDYVSRQFQKSTGIKFSQYLTEQRIKRAKELLLQEGGSKILYIAEQVGFGTNSQYFSQIFKKVTGATPSRWLQQMQKGKNERAPD